MSRPVRVSLISLGTLTAALLATHGAWLLLVACVAALETEGDPT